MPYPFPRNTVLSGTFSSALAFLVACSGGTGGDNSGAGSGGAPAGTTGGVSGETAIGGSSTAKGGATSVSGGSSTDGSSVGGSASQAGGSNVGGAIAAGGTAAAGGTNGQGGTTGVVVVSDAIFVAPDALANASGTIDDPMPLLSALSRATAGKTIYLRGGTYRLDSTVALNLSGSSGSPITLRAYPLDNQRPLFDFSAMVENANNRGFNLSGSYWHLYGLDVYSAGDNCMFVSGSNNVIEFSTFYECSDTGLQLGGGAANNVVRNCDSYYNADSALENADGFAAKLDVGSGNKFVGCRAWNNLDDGWDGYLRGADNVTTTYEDCWAIDNGKLKNGSTGAGDGNGFKTGGSDDKALKHNATYTRCIATGNVTDGFDHNSNRGSVTLLNCAAHNNGSNINFSSTNSAASLKVKNTASIGTLGGLLAASTDITNNSWQNGRSATAADYVSIDTTPLKAPRKSDGSLPDINYLKLVTGSDLRNAGTNVGLPYNGSAPDVGPFESVE